MASTNNLLPLPLTAQAAPYPGARPRRREVPRPTWPAFQSDFFAIWEPGEHVSVISPTGRGGKSWLITRGLLPYWSEHRVLYIDIKDRDRTLHKFGHRVESFPNRLQVEWASKPKWFRLHVRSGLAGRSLAQQQRTVYEAMAAAFKQRDWVIVADELAFLANDLKLMQPLRDIWKRGRTNVTMIAATQSPRWVPAEAYDQPTYLFLGRLGAEGNKRLGEIGGTVNYHAVRQALGDVHTHEFLFLDKAAEDPEAAMQIVKVG